MQATKNQEAVATATGHLLTVVDDARILEVLARHFQELVNGRINPTGLIGTEMADTIEHHALELVSAIRGLNETIREARASKS